MSGGPYRVCARIKCMPLEEIGWSHAFEGLKVGSRFSFAANGLSVPAHIIDCNPAIPPGRCGLAVIELIEEGGMLNLDVKSQFELRAGPFLIGSGIVLSVA